MLQKPQRLTNDQARGPRGRAGCSRNPVTDPHAPPQPGRIETPVPRPPPARCFATADTVHGSRGARSPGLPARHHDNVQHETVQRPRDLGLGHVACLSGRLSAETMDRRGHGAGQSTAAAFG
jgi:hypothetical protein